MISALLSHRTRNAASGKAFKALRERFPTWDEVMQAETGEIEEAIAGVTWPELKAPRIRAILSAIQARAGRLSLDFLAELSPPEARAWLEQFPGIGPKTSAAVLSFSSLRMRALPVDSHHHRVAQRLGLIGKKVGLGPAHILLLRAATRRLDGSGSLRQPRDPDAARTAGLPPSPPGLRALPPGRSLPERTERDARALRARIVLTPPRPGCH